LVARREAMLELGGFNEKLYPNEENALMDELQKGEGKLLYDPDLIVHRRPRSNLKSFMKMLMTYGRGRAEQFRVHPTFGSVLNFAPPILLAYIILLLIEIGLVAARVIHPPPMCLWVSFSLLCIYAAIILIETLALARRGGLARAFGALPLIILTHLLYGFGFWQGMFTTLRAPNGAAPPSGGRPIEVVLEHVRV